MAATRSLDEWFGDGRKWRVAEEVTGTATMQKGIKVVFDRGHFTIAPSPPGGWRSPLSTNASNRGFVLIETDPTGAHDIGERVAFAEQHVRQARKQGAIW
jgi:hypothetical protein